MRKIWILFITVILCFTLVGCNMPISEVDNDFMGDEGGEINGTKYLVANQLYQISEKKEPELLYSFRDDNNFYYFFDLGVINNVPLEDFSNAFHFRNMGQTITRTFESTSVDTSTITNEVSKTTETSISTEETTSFSIAGEGMIGVCKLSAELAYSKTKHESSGQSFYESYSSASSYSTSNTTSITISFGEEALDGYYAYVLTGALRVYALVAKDIENNSYVVDYYSEILLHWTDFYYFTSSDEFVNYEYEKINFVLPENLEEPTEYHSFENNDIGNGTQESPYLISSKDEFIKMLENSSENTYYKLISDIDLGDWSTYGILNWNKESKNPPKYFTGKFDGNNKTIKYSIKIGKTSLLSWALGLFPTTKNALIQNVNVVADIKTYDPQNRNQKWDISNDDRGWDVMVGGIVGYANNTSILNCVTTGNIRYNSDGGSGETCVAGIVGYALSCDSISNCSSSANIYARGFSVLLSGVIAGCYDTKYSNLTSTANLQYNMDWIFGSAHVNPTIAVDNISVLPKD